MRTARKPYRQAATPAPSAALPPYRPARTPINNNEGTDMTEHAKPWTHYRARLARLSQDPTATADEIATVRRLMGRAHLKHRAEQLAHDATAAHLTARERGELAGIVRDGGEAR